MDYQAIAWLVDQDYVNRDQATQLIQSLAKEVLESFLTLTEGTHEFLEKSTLSDFPSLCQLDLRALVDECQTQLRQQTQPSRSPSRSPSRDVVTTDKPAIAQLESPQNDASTQGQAREGIIPPAKKLHRVACIDDSPTVLNAINSFLDPEYFSIILINDPLKALMQIIRCKPDLILLDIGMPSLDGYELCSLLRKHSNLKHTPVVMVTGNTGFIDRAKAKLVGASGYLTKPFTRAELMKMVFKHLT
jgi:chemotaxis family two-component system response regulator PixG